MDSLIINPISSINGDIIASPSKSYSHRAFIAASLADGVSVIKNPLTSGDVSVTINLLKELHVNIREESGNTFLIKRTDKSYKYVYNSINCGNSGTTLRIFSALSLLIDEGLTFTGEFLKRNRPILPLLDSLKAIGAQYKLSKNTLHINRIHKFCEPIKIRGDISSQFITALLFLSPLLKCNNLDYIEIEITTPLVSYPYIQITLDVLKSFGIKILEKIDENRKGKYIIESQQKFRPQVYTIPGDFSSAAFVIAATVISQEDSHVVINNLNFQNPQGDKKIIEILRDMGANIEIFQNERKITIKGGTNRYPLKGIAIDCSEIPDLFPVLCVVSAFSKGKTTLYNASNLRLKESDRISVMARELKKMGVRVEEYDDKLVVYHCESIEGVKIDHENDHRIAMACFIAALYAKTTSEIKNIDIVKDSYPTFIDDFKKLGVSLK